MEEDSVKRQLNQTKNPRPFDSKNFLNWYQTKTSHYFEAEQSRRQRQQSLEQQKVCEEEASCRFSSKQRAEEADRPPQADDRGMTNEMADDLVSAKWPR